MNIAMLLEMAADGFGDRIAMSGHNRNVTYAELRRQATAIAAALAPEPQTVVLHGELSALVPAALFGSAWAVSSGYIPCRRVSPGLMGK